MLLPLVSLIRSRFFFPFWLPSRKVSASHPLGVLLSTIVGNYLNGSSCWIVPSVFCWPSPGGSSRKIKHKLLNWCFFHYYACCWNTFSHLLLIHFFSLNDQNHVQNVLRWLHFHPPKSAHFLWVPTAKTYRHVSFHLFQDVFNQLQNTFKNKKRPVAL